jgi:hypothetical protein
LKQISLVNLEFKNITDRASFEQIHTIKFIYFGRLKHFIYRRDIRRDVQIKYYILEDIKYRELCAVKAKWCVRWKNIDDIKYKSRNKKTKRIK